MNDAVSSVSATGAEAVQVWDPLVRIFHWSLVMAFFGAYALGEDGGRWHQALGYTVLGLVAFRLVWGVIGSPHARFKSFVPTPHRAIGHFRDLVARREARYLGHNPAGALMIVALLLALIGTGFTGWLQTTDAFWGSETMENVHVGFVNGTLALVGLHVIGVVFSSLRHRENLVRAMLTGRKRAECAERNAGAAHAASRRHLALRQLPWRHRQAMRGQ